MARNGNYQVTDKRCTSVGQYIIMLTLGVDKTVCPKTEEKKYKNPRDEL